MMDLFSEQQQAAHRAARTLWLRPAADGTLTVPAAAGAGDAQLLLRLTQHCEPGPNDADRADLLNELHRHGDFCSIVHGALFAALAAGGVLPGRGLGADGKFLLRQAAAVLTFIGALREAFGAALPSHLLPGAFAMLERIEPPEADEEALLRRIAAFDPFAGGRCFRYRNGGFEPTALEAVRSLERFYGFHGVRRSFREQFREFAAGKSTVPLLISSLPGHGKTQMTIAHALAHANLTLILAPADALETPLEELIAQLRVRDDRRFVVFFDDVDPNVLDWYTFRTHVGGTFTLPDHVMLAVASNYEFPPSILSRGRSVAFPTFDDVRCMEMVEEFLGTWGFRRPNNNLISLISARYTEEFGQKRYTELSPRTLMRYLALFEESAQKRKDMVQLACGQMVTKPDPQLFYEFNIGLMRKLYGNEYIENLLKERLRALA